MPAYVTPIVPTPSYTAPVLPAHLLGVGPWNSSVIWRGAPNHGVAAGARASVPIINLPMASSKTVTLRLGEGSEAKSSHYFARNEAVVIEENITDLWWRRRDPRRGIMERLGRFNAATVDMSIADGGLGVDASITYVDYQALLEDRLVMQWLTPSIPVVPATVPPTWTTPKTQWATNTLVTDILRWCVPTNAGIDLTGIQAATPDLAIRTKAIFEIDIGISLADVFKNLLTVSASPWEWWVEAPASDTDRPRLTLAVARGADRGVALFDIGGQGPIESWSLQRADNAYANALFFMGHDGGVVFQYDDQIALQGQRDASFSDDTVPGTVDASNVPYLLNAAAQTKLAQLAAPTPSYQLVLRQGFWEGRAHIDVGDWVTINLELGDDVVGGKYRVSELEVAIDGNGMETVTVTLGAKRPSKDPRSRASATARLVRYLRKSTLT